MEDKTDDNIVTSEQNENNESQSINNERYETMVSMFIKFR